MGILDFIAKAQANINNAQKKVYDLQKRIETTPAESFFEKKKQAPASVKEEKPKPHKENKPRQTKKPHDAEQQILALRDSMKRNGFNEYEYIANSNCCEICAKLNGKHFLVSELKIGVNAPPMHDGCSCSIAAYSDRKEYEDWLDFLSKGGTTKEWEKGKKH